MQFNCPDSAFGTVHKHRTKPPFPPYKLQNNLSPIKSVSTENVQDHSLHTLGAWQTVAGRMSTDKKKKTKSLCRFPGVIDQYTTAFSQRGGRKANWLNVAYTGTNGVSCNVS